MPRRSREFVVQTVIQANNLTLQMVQDLADLKAHVTENMVTKAHLAETLSQYDLKNMVTKADFEREFARLYRNLLFGSLGCVTLIIAAMSFL